MRGTQAGGRRLGATTTLVVVALLIAPVAAGAKSWVVGDFKYVKRTVNLPAAGAGESAARGVKAGCGAGYELTGGGASPKGDGGRTFLSTTSFGGTRSWFAEAWHRNSPNKDLAGFAACLRDVTVERNTDLDPVGAGPVTVIADVSCPLGLVDWGGGLRAIGEPTDWHLAQTFPLDLNSDMDIIPDDGWRISAAWDGASTTSVIADVICGEEVPAYRETDIKDLDAGDVVTAKTMCESGRVIGGGGIINGASEQAHIVASYPIDGNDGNKAPDDGWAVKASNDQGADKTVSPRAVCL